MPAWASVVLLAAALLLALGYWTYRAVEDSLRELRAAGMKSLLDSEVNALRVWVSEELSDVERIARDAAHAPAASRRCCASPRCSGPARAKLEEAHPPGCCATRAMPPSTS